VEYYNKSIVNNSQVEFIHVSQNIKLADALEWASDATGKVLAVSEKNCIKKIKQLTGK